MSTFKNIEKLGLKVKTDYRFGTGYPIVNAMELESLLKSAQVVYGTNEYRPDEYEWSKNKLDSDTHFALLVGVTPIKKQTKAEAALELIVKLAKDPAYYSSLGAAEAKRILDMKDEV